MNNDPRSQSKMDLMNDDLTKLPGVRSTRKTKVDRALGNLDDCIIRFMGFLNLGVNGIG